MKTEAKTEVLGVKAPEKECTDKKCPFHGEINVKKELFRGKIIKKDIGHTATVEWTRQYFVKKYERFEKRRSRIKVHNPTCINAEIGAEVLVAKTRPLSKTKHHVILKIIKE
ncbi:MAG TPA: 30S ribosomal protein S17 [Candidatus Nanoarchaeia archaeon]|nr:30S ribosomal protein S17 [Candidatus Nanoarchaeia archaeon]